MVITALLAFFAQNNRLFFIPGLFFTQKIKIWLSQAIRQRGIVVAGMLNGLLPCGMVYFALAGAISATSGWNSALYMAIFGLGTLPALMLAGLVNAPIRPYIRWAQPLLMAIAGLLLINRGLSVDLSFWEFAVPKAGFDCH